MTVENLADIVMGELSFTNGCMIVMAVVFAIVSIYLYLVVRRQEREIRMIRTKLNHEIHRMNSRY